MKHIRNIRGPMVAGILFLAVASLLAQSAPPKNLPPIPPVPTVPPADANSGSKILAWDADLKEASPKLGEPIARFTFSVTNVSDDEVVINDAKPSCGCTEATMPSKPWHLAAHSNGVINVGVNLAGKAGTFFKWVDVNYGSNATKRLNIKVTMATDPAMARNENQARAKADRQAVFKGDCAKCHATPAAGKMGKELYAAACEICHDATPRASAVPDLHALNHSTDLTYWKVWISQGKQGSMMPAFSTKEGGPLTDEQIDSLAEAMMKAFPPGPLPIAVKSAALAPASPPQKN